MDTWVLRRVRERCIRRLAALTLALGCIVLFAVVEYRYISNFLMGPFHLDQDDLDSIHDISAAPRYFARVAGSKVINTGIQQITIRKRGGVENSRSVSAAYYALLVGDRLLIIKSSANARTNWEGELKIIGVELDRQLFQAPTMQAIHNRFYPFYLDDGSFRFPGYFAIIATLSFGFFLVRFGVSAWRQLHDPLSHPVVRRVASWGDPIGLALDVERESRTPHHKSGGWLVTDKYLIRSTFFKFDLLLISNLLWAYKRVTKHRVNFIPSGETHEAILVCYGGTAVVNGSEGIVTGILAFAADRAPWAIFGFSKELERLFNKSNMDFCAAVEQRRHDSIQRSRGQPNAG
jgi:hypothetical protein